jgi:beta propeller repeat protein
VPAISGNRIVWLDRVELYGGEAGLRRSPRPEHRHDMQITTTPSSEPAIWGDRIAWMDYREGQNWDIYL